jgi:hypothetical protein
MDDMVTPNACWSPRVETEYAPKVVAVANCLEICLFDNGKYEGSVRYDVATLGRGLTWWKYPTAV